MQKKTKSRLVDFIVIIVCLAGSALSVWQFWKELNKTLVKLNDEPIATITFKYNTAQRRFSDNLVWDRLRQNSPVYNGDTIRTADFSEATIYFNDGNIMDLSENTMARVSINSGGGAAVDFSGGQIAVQTADTGLTITSGSSVVDIVKGASVTASSAIDSVPGKESTDKSDEVFRVQVQSGSAELTTGTQAVSLDAGKTADMKGDGNVVRKKLSVLSPDPEYKVINFDKDEIPVEFRWDSDGRDIKIELSDTKTFTSIRESYEYSGVEQVSMMLPSGTHYWRIISDEEMLNGKVTVYDSKAPVAIAPVEDYTAHYRTVKPSIRFIWSESERSTTYAFEVADNAEMENPVISQRIQQTSSIVTTLDEGKWYWRVTPYYTINNIGFSHPSDVYSFSIEKSGALEAPELLMPKSGAVVTTKLPDAAGAGSQNILFSWKDNPEAVSYTLTITPESSAYGSEIKQTLNANYYSLDTSLFHVGNGSWKWSVSMTDVEGNGVTSEEVPFLAMDSEITQRPIFPSEGYMLSHTRVQDTNFVWKSNVPSDMEVQIAEDSSFNKIVASLKTKNTSASGFDLPVGTYYWRIVAETDIDTFVSDAVRFDVEAALMAPACVQPENEGRVVIENNSFVTLSWKPVKTANYYQFRVYDSEDMGEPIYENAYIEDDGSEVFSETISVYGYDEKTYYWTVPAFRDESATMSRTVSSLGKYSFALRRLKPIVLLSPADKERLDGLEVVMNPPEIVWNSEDELGESELLIYKGSLEESNLVADIKDPEQNVTMPRLYEGSYFWTVRGITLDDLDVTSRQVRNFIVDAIPPMDAPVQNPPSDVFDTRYFEYNSEVSFNWKPVLYATEYVFTLFDSDGTELKSVKIPAPQTSYNVDFNNMGHAGNYTWTIEARTIFDDGVVRYGNKGTSGITISLPDMDAPVKNPVGTQNVINENLYHVDKSIRFSWKAVPYADEYVFTLKNAHGTVLVKEFMRSRKVAAAIRNDEPETFFVYRNIDSMEPGSYSWSVEARNYIDGKLMQPGKTEDTSFVIKVGDMAAPEKVYPTANQVFGSILFKDDEGLRFAWKPVDYADEYVFRLYDHDRKLMVEQVTSRTEFIYENLESLVKENCTWTVEARCYFNGKLLQNGTKKESFFSIEITDLEPPQTRLPVQNAVFETDFFVKNEPQTFSWNTVPLADEYIFKLYAPDGSVKLEHTGDETFVAVDAVDMLAEGEYRWTVEALSHYHGEILQHGKTKDTTFTVRLSALDEPVKEYPASGLMFGSELFKADEGLRFVWQPVNFADEYVFRLYNYDGELVEEQSTPETEYILRNLEVLSKGKYSWSVEARRNLGGIHLHSETTKKAQFEIYLPLLRAPEKATPAEGHVLSAEFFLNGEELDFRWKKIKYADEYILTITSPDGTVLREVSVADDDSAEEFEYTVPSAELLKHGEYKWTVEALLHYHGELIQNGTTEESTFSVIIPDLDMPVASIPVDDTTLGIEFFMNDTPQEFVWGTVPLADEYVFKLSSPDGSLIREYAGAETSLTVDASEFLSDGEYTWTVEARSHFNGDVLQYGKVGEYHIKSHVPNPSSPVIISPADDITVDSSYFKNESTQQFSWKSVPFADEYVFRFEKEDGTMVFEEHLPADTLRIDVETELFSYEGNYKWSVQANNYFRDNLLRAGESEDHPFIVSLPKLPYPENTLPASETLYGMGLFKTLGSIDFCWDAVESAECYALTVTGPDGDNVLEKVLQSHDADRDGVFRYHADASSFTAEGDYVWAVEARIMYKDRVIQTSGRVENTFAVSLPAPDAPELISEPEILIDVDYINNNDTVALSWKAVEFADDYDVVFYGTDGSVITSRKIHATNDTVSTVFPLSLFLEPGQYRMTLTAEILYLGDVFRRSGTAETVMTTEFPVLEGFELISPETNVVFNALYFRKNREIVFSWTAVPYASGYDLVIYGADDNPIYEQTLDADCTDFHFVELSLLDTGVFRWTARPFFAKDGKILVEGTILQDEFTIDLPSLKAPSVDDTGRLYGN